MGFWKTVGYAAAGLVVAGPVGAVAGASASLGKGKKKKIKVPTLVGVPLSKKEQLAAEKREREKEAAYFAQELDKMKKKEAEQVAKMRDILNGAREYNKYFEFLIACVAVGVAAANSDGNISKEEIDCIDLFISSVAQFPNDIAEKIQSIKNHPVNIREAFEYAVNSGVDIDLFDQVISIVVNSDGYLHEDEHTFINTWMELKGGVCEHI
ncbi:MULTISPECIES: TerB family tellurite resistance protein [Enterobacteriaceae]|uniref:tellurite resistance TerB family protein n=1 Tax=Enterobacteriaceae TaxID=543 RepID=UPI000BDF18D6|nr:MULTISPECIES: TerB family tellurite resistance protein [Enterobacteriaceae]EFN5154987.1 TerB family tellurite resistance protein [Escherichia coli]QLV91314.1 TerB family tellurite resistance protein [Citrobacter freundii]HAW0382439.1 TerB family tellurite resistance protein [Escherichia coli]HAW0644418.1 TerB family tellurite resistance protein [Escherichia coli]